MHWPGPSEVVDDHVLKTRPAGAAELKRHGIAARRHAGGRPKDENDNTSNAVKRVLRFVVGVGPKIIDFGPRPGPTRPRCGLGKAPAGAPLDLHSPVDQF